MKKLKKSELVKLYQQSLIGKMIGNYKVTEQGKYAVICEAPRANMTSLYAAYNYEYSSVGGLFFEHGEFGEYEKVKLCFGEKEQKGSWKRVDYNGNEFSEFITRCKQNLNENEMKQGLPRTTNAVISHKLKYSPKSQTLYEIFSGKRRLPVDKIPFLLNALQIEPLSLTWFEFYRLHFKCTGIVPAPIHSVLMTDKSAMPYFWNIISRRTSVCAYYNYKENGCTNPLNSNKHCTGVDCGHRKEVTIHADMQENS